VKWDAQIRAASDTVAADPILSVLFPTMRYAGTGDHTVPLLEHHRIAYSEDELWAYVTIQWDLFCESLEALQAAERQLNHLFHVEVQREYGGMPMWSQFVEGDVLATPDRDGYFGEAIRFRMAALRERYEPSPYL
jgi:hypothetical protein